MCGVLRFVLIWPCGSLGFFQFCNILAERERAGFVDLIKFFRFCLCQNVCDALTFLLDNIFIRFGTKLYRQVVGIPMGTTCAPLVADLFLFCYERDFMMSLSDDKQADVIDTFNTTFRYLDDILNINNVYFDNMVSQIYPSESSN